MTILQTVYQPHQDASALRSRALHLMVDKNLAGPKFDLMGTLANKLSAFTGIKISRQTLSMALSGTRSGPKYALYLDALIAMIASNNHLVLFNTNTPKHNNQGEA